MTTKDFSVIIDGQSIIEFDRNHALTETQQQSLNYIDQQLDQGIELAGHTIENPDLLMRSQYIANNLLEAINAEQENIIALLSGWLATRIPELRRMQVSGDKTSRQIELVTNDASSAPEVTLSVH